MVVECLNYGLRELYEQASARSALQAGDWDRELLCNLAIIAVNLKLQLDVFLYRLGRYHSLRRLWSRFKQHILHSCLPVGLLEILFDICHTFAILAILVPDWLYIFEDVPLCFLLALPPVIVDEVEEVQSLPSTLQKWITTSHLFIF